MNFVNSIWNFFFILLRNIHFRNVFSTFTNVVKLKVENDNVVSTLSNVVHINVETSNVDSKLFDIVNFQRGNIQRCFNNELMLSHVATLYQPKDNVKTTLKCLLDFSTFKIGSPFWFPIAERKLWTKAHFPPYGKYVSTSRNEGFVENYVFTRWKSCFWWQ